jgi:hypothetical protein
MLLEDFLSPSDNTQAVFRVYIPHSGLMTRLKVKYLLCPTSILSSNFNILVNQYNSGTITAESFIDYPVSDTLNTTPGPLEFGYPDSMLKRWVELFPFIPIFSRGVIELWSVHM